MSSGSEIATRTGNPFSTVPRVDVIDVLVSRLHYIKGGDVGGSDRGTGCRGRRGNLGRRVGGRHPILPGTHYVSLPVPGASLRTGTTRSWKTSDDDEVLERPRPTPRKPVQLLHEGEVESSLGRGEPSLSVREEEGRPVPTTPFFRPHSRERLCLARGSYLRPVIHRK